jgi:hypothetical protein
MLDDCEFASDASSVLRRASRTEAGWLARLARERAEQEREALELGLERELQVWQPRTLCDACIWPRDSRKEIRAVDISTSRSAQFPRLADARRQYPCYAKAGTSRGRTDRVGRSFALIQQRACGTVQGGPDLPGQYLALICPIEVDQS